MLLYRLINSAIDLAKLFICVELLEEHGLILLDADGVLLHISMKAAVGKVDLFQSEILDTLRNNAEKSGE